MLFAATYARLPDLRDPGNFLVSASHHPVGVLGSPMHVITLTFAWVLGSQARGLTLA